MTLAAAALAQGRPALARGFRLHRPRGAFCHAGWCQQCRVRLADGSVALACETAADGRARHGFDPLRAIGFLAESLPPWFFEHRLQRPRVLRQSYLDLLRRLSAAPRVPPVESVPCGRWRERACEVLVVGGGLAGLAAARALAEAGRDVLLVERGELGGSARFIPSLADEHASRIHAIAQPRLTALESTPCLGLYDRSRTALCLSPEGPLVVAFERLVVATGAYDRLLAFRGNDLPGIVGVRAFERLASFRAVPRGWRVGIVAAESESRRAVEAAAAAGLELAWLAGPGELADGPWPRHPHARIEAALGRGRVLKVELEPGGARACDLLVLGFSQPSYQLQL
ncbi:MAG: FAD-dependent oxidoreductase, partial [Alphaproteobacteria bacterium]